MQRAGRVHVFYFRSVTRFFLSPGQDYSGAGMRHMVCMDVGKLKTNKQTKLSHPELKEHIPDLDPQASRQAPPINPTRTPASRFY